MARVRRRQFGGKRATQRTPNAYRGTPLYSFEYQSAHMCEQTTQSHKEPSERIRNHIGGHIGPGIESVPDSQSEIPQNSCSIIKALRRILLHYCWGKK